VSSDGNNLIFVSIAAYRDPQLVPTVEDCIAKARHPERLRFGICWQHSPGEDTLPYRDDDCFRILAIDWRDSKGACWARSEVMKLWRGEEWFLQVDSHCRFAFDWDVKLIEETRLTGSPKPVLSTYASPFTPGGEEILDEGPLQMAFQGFTDDGIPHMKPVAIPDWRNLKGPRRARFLSAGFLFTHGRFVEEVGYDPELYFLGEEAAMTLRAFTGGYDLFHPHETIVWHDYGRPSAAKHWGDHTEVNSVSRQWHKLDSHSKNKVRRLITGQPVDSYGLGSERSLEEYETYAGISLKLRKVQDYTVRCEEPPNPEAGPDWMGQIFTWMVRITVNRAMLPIGALEDPSFWYVGIRDEGGTEIYRQDIPQSQLAELPATEPTLVLFCEFESGTIPASWIVWPVSDSLGWLAKLEDRLADGDYTIVAEDRI
jgi:Glycosyltransferase (GlcNAc)